MDIAVAMIVGGDRARGGGGGAGTHEGAGGGGCLLVAAFIGESFKVVRPANSMGWQTVKTKVRK